MKAITRKRLQKRKRKIDRRLARKAKGQAKQQRRRGGPVMNPDGKKYEVSEKRFFRFFEGSDEFIRDLRQLLPGLCANGRAIVSTLL
jgi:hypothetical protein